MNISARFQLSLVCSVALTLTACGPAPNGAGPAGPSEPGQAPVEETPPAAPPVSDSPNMSAQAATIHHLSQELINLMDDVHNKKIMSARQVSDVRHAFAERLTWIDDMSADEVAEMRKATEALDDMVAEIRAHPSAAGDAALEARLKKLEDFNRSIKEAIPQ